MDRATFDSLILEHLPGALRFAVRLTGNTADAEDIVQEAMLRASKASSSFEGRSSFRTWLFRIVINVFRDTHRASRRYEALPDDPGGGFEPARFVESRELSETVARSVSSLPERQREVLVLVVYEGLDPSQAAELLGITPQNARTNLHYARERLKHSLKDYLPERRK